MRKTIKMKPAIPNMGEPDDYVSHSENYQNLTPSTIDDIQAQNDSRASRVNELLNKITSTNDAVDNNKMGNFNPISPPSITNKKEPPKPPVSTAYSGNYSGDEIKSPVYSNYAKSYDGSAKPYYANMGIGQGQGTGQGTVRGLPDDKLIEKINYMIHLLEQQQHEKTSNITEEFILYTMLGVFVIYVVDSFARSGKYIR